MKIKILIVYLLISGVLMAKDVKGITATHSDDVNSVIDTVVTEIEKGIIALNTAMSGTISGISAGSTVEADLVALNEALRSSGFLSIVGAALNNSYTDVINISGQLNETINNRIFLFSKGSVKKLKALKDSTFENIKDATQVYLGKINNGINAIRFGTGNANAIIKDISDIFGKTLTNQAGTLIDTGVSAAWSESNVLLAEDNGIERFLYAGSLIATSRPFCIEHLNQVKTIEEWNLLDNGQGLSPISAFRGGFNCRHVLVGVA